MLGFFNYTTWLTYMGLASGVTGIFCAMSGHETAAIICLCLAGFFDLFDGKVASTKKDRTDEMKRFGIQIDSLSDLVCFGVLPATIFFTVFSATFPDKNPLWLCPLAVIYVLSALIRLAYFNVSEETRQKKENGVRKSYNGIPVTTTALIFPFFFAIFSLLNAIFGASESLSIGYFICYCAEMAFFTFGFLFKGFKIAKMHGKKMLIPLIVGVIVAIAVLISFFLKK